MRKLMLASLLVSLAAGHALAQDRKVISTPNAPEAIGPYSQAVQGGRFLFTSGQLGIDPATGELAHGVEAQTEQAMRNLSEIYANETDASIDRLLGMIEPALVGLLSVAIGASAGADMS